MKRPEYVRLNLRVRKDVGDYWKGRRQASKMLTEASIPMIEENGESLASVNTRLRALLEEDRAAHETDIRRHAEISILQQRVQLAGGAMLQDATVDSHILEVRERFAEWRRQPAHVRKAPKKGQGLRSADLAWCDSQIRRIPVLKERFGTPDELLGFLEGNA